MQGAQRVHGKRRSARAARVDVHEVERPPEGRDGRPNSGFTEVGALAETCWLECNRTRPGGMARVASCVHK